jgi:hypothetical protein
MKKFLLLLGAIVPIASSTAHAMVPIAELQPFALAFAPGTGTSTSSLPPGGSIPLDCNFILDKAIDDLQSGARKVDNAYSTLLVGEKAYAEASSKIVAGGGSGFATYGGDAQLSAGKIKGTSHVATPGATARTDLAFTLSMVSGKAKMNWSFGGKSYSGSLDNCTSGYWTASTATSSIAIKMDVFVPPPPPE